MFDHALVRWAVRGGSSGGFDAITPITPSTHHLLDFRVEDLFFVDVGIASEREVDEPAPAHDLKDVEASAVAAVRASICIC
jgi:hypothetical protein